MRRIRQCLVYSGFELVSLYRFASGKRQKGKAVVSKGILATFLVVLQDTRVYILVALLFAIHGVHVNDSVNRGAD
jgi:hypothetical protein